MTQRLEKTFAHLRERGEGAFVPFLILGDPDPDTSFQLITQLIDGGADILELGLPFSDPPGDGPVIQAAGQRALKTGMTTARALQLIRRIRETSQLPISLLCYYNIVLQYGTDSFYRDASVAGVDAVLIADLPLEESAPVVASARRYGVQPVFMISDLTTPTRMSQIATVCEGYVYAVAHIGVTGEQHDMAAGLQDMFARCRRHINLPILAGFGISSPEHVREALQAGVDGVICGSAIVRRISQYVDQPAACLTELRTFMEQMKLATTTS